MFVFVFTVLVLPGFTVTVGEENTCNIRDLKTLFVKMLTTENSINTKIEDSTNAFLTELKVMQQHETQQDNEVTSLKANYIETIKQINETENSINAKIEESTNAFLTEQKVMRQHWTRQDNEITRLKANYVETIKQINETENIINAKIEESTNAFLTELKVIKQQVAQQDNEVTTLKANYVETIKQINETVQAENMDIKERLDGILQNMTVLTTKLDVFLTAMDGGWSSWSNWTDCSVTCGYGLIKRTRVCNNTEPSGFGRGCVGNNEEVMICNTFQCPSCTINSCKKVSKYNAAYDIYPGKKCNRMVVYCDQTTDGGGWIVIQRRKDGSVDFERTWTDYKSGFGDLEEEFWLGNDNIHTLTAAGFNELRVDMGDFEGNTAYAKYSNFSIKSESDKYTLTVNGYSGNAGDSLAYHNGMAFTTRDRDNDIRGDNCAVTFRGAWWYQGCHHSNLNGYYYHGAGSPSSEGINWHSWKGYSYSLKFVEMKIR